MDVSLFDYDLPVELIAQHPTRKRDQSRLMILDRSTGELRIKPFRHIIDYLSGGDALVVNQTKVFKARLFGRRPTGGKVEIFLVRPTELGSQKTWEALVHPSRRVKEGERVLFDNEPVDLLHDVGGGRWLIGFNSDSQCRRIISRFGHVPLPHYIKREDQPSDIRRYQTVFADEEHVGAVAAPTAGFHFTRPVVNALTDLGVRVIRLCLHVGPGTFKPVKVQDIDDHVVDPELAELNSTAASELNRVRGSKGRVFAVGTTSVRTLESAPISGGLIEPFAGMVDLYIKPGYRFDVVDRLLTNFHLPKSSLLILVSAFCGRELILEAYREAIRQRMRFYSYGDAMLIL